jgi:hypothetical protein
MAEKLRRMIEVVRLQRLPQNPVVFTQNESKPIQHICGSYC